jgi:hypothetical protein
MKLADAPLSNRAELWQMNRATSDELIGAVAILAARAGADGDVIVSEPPVVEIR